jgi:hypothetical protein
MHNHSPSDTLNPSAAVRAKLCEALRLDLIGPHNDHAFARELLPERPERWYLTGFLVPFDATAAERIIDQEPDEELDGGASTATVRRADAQIRALFGRDRAQVFPPPGPNRHDSFFAQTKSVQQVPGRRYLGVAAPGRSFKLVYLRTMLALMSAAERLYQQAPKNPSNPADPYMSLLGYFSSLRELGGSRRIVEDEVLSKLERYSERQRLEPADVLFANRKIKEEALELTSRVATNVVAENKRKLSEAHSTSDHVDVALATNMISVGLDITRLGLMLVVGQPKASAEYIQATSRVGRDVDKPGLVVTLLNVHRARDHSHFERFTSFHESFYRSVEASSVTPFSPRALDRALAGVLVGMARHLEPRLSPSDAASRITELRASLDALAERFAKRAQLARADSELVEQVRNRVANLLDAWVKVQMQLAETQTGLKYQPQESGTGKSLLREFLDPELPQLSPPQRRFRAARSMREIEPSTELEIKTLDTWKN